MEQGNGLRCIEAHTPNYKKDFPEVEEQLELYNKLDSLFKLVQNNYVKNLYNSYIDGEKEITMVLSVGDKNTREIISKINNKDNYQIIKNGENYCELSKIYNGNYKINNMSEDFYNDYADNIALLTNDITGEKKYVTLDEILNSNQKDFPNKSITILNHNFNFTNDTKKPKNSNYFLRVLDPQKKKYDYDYLLKSKEKPVFFEYNLKPKTFHNFHIETKEKKRIEYEDGYYIGWLLNDKRDGEGIMKNYNGEYEDGFWENDKFYRRKC